MRERPTNLVYVFADQLRYRSLGYAGMPNAGTPTIDRFAGQGVNVSNAVATAPVCTAYRASLLTGKYTTSHGMVINELRFNPNQRCFGHALTDAGYHTGYIGKWHLADRDPVPPEQRAGYQTWLAADLLEFCSDAYETVLYDEQEQAVRLPGYRADALVDAAIRFVDRHQDEPFFLFLSFLEPHHQNHRDDYPAPDGYAERYTGRWTPPDCRSRPRCRAARSCA
jgi:arylsulfatase A-like enzyme